MAYKNQLSLIYISARHLAESELVGFYDSNIKFNQYIRQYNNVLVSSVIFSYFGIQKIIISYRDRLIDICSNFTSYRFYAKPNLMRAFELYLENNRISFPVEVIMDIRD